MTSFYSVSFFIPPSKHFALKITGLVSTFFMILIFRGSRSRQIRLLRHVFFSPGKRTADFPYVSENLYKPLFSRFLRPPFSCKSLQLSISYVFFGVGIGVNGVNLLLQRFLRITVSFPECEFLGKVVPCFPQLELHNDFT